MIKILIKLSAAVKLQNRFWDKYTNNQIKSYLPFVGKGRFYGQAPEIDGQIYIQARPEQSEPIPGEFIQVKINQAQTYDLWGELVE